MGESVSSTTGRLRPICLPKFHPTQPIPPVIFSDSKVFLHELDPAAGIKRMVSAMPRGVHICGIDFDFGKEPAVTFTRDQHPDRGSHLQSASAAWLGVLFKDILMDSVERNSIESNRL